MRGVGSSHRGYSIFFGKFFKKNEDFCWAQCKFQKNPNFRLVIFGANYGPPTPILCQKPTSFAQKCLRFRKPEVLPYTYFHKSGSGGDLQSSRRDTATEVAIPLAIPCSRIPITHKIHTVEWPDPFGQTPSPPGGLRFSTAYPGYFS